MSETGVKSLTAWESPFGMRAHLGLELKGIKYEYIEEDLRNNKSKLLLESNPVHKKIPVLIHNGKPVAESAIILHYLDEAWPDKVPFFPKDPYARSQLRFWGDFVDNKFFVSYRKFLVGKTEEEQSAGNIDFIESCKILEDALAKKETKGPFFGGETMSYADIMLAPFGVWIAASVEVLNLKFPAEEYPNLKKLFDAATEHPACKVACPEVNKIKAYIETRLFLWRGA